MPGKVTFVDILHIQQRCVEMGLLQHPAHPTRWLNPAIGLEDADAHTLHAAQSFRPARNRFGNNTLGQKPAQHSLRLARNIEITRCITRHFNTFFQQFISSEVARVSGSGQQVTGSGSMDRARCATDVTIRQRRKRPRNILHAAIETDPHCKCGRPSGSIVWRWSPYLWLKSSTSS
ncbi:MAG: hypothetical protein EOP50_18780 [Sphingobacteriales bacterium]|nr:MAG: hypothetical protein EOP50_18780 [Sphingobacteriales bacterium]